MNLAQLSSRTIPALIKELQDMVARINTVFSLEHYADGRHKFGWFASEFTGASNFSGDAGQVWTVPIITTLRAKKKGTDMTVAFEFFNSTVSGTPAHLEFRIPGGFTAAGRFTAMIYLTDNATLTSGFAIVEQGSQTIDLWRADVATFTGGTTHAMGQLTFETTA